MNQQKLLTFVNNDFTVKRRHMQGEYTPILTILVKILSHILEQSEKLFVLYCYMYVNQKILPYFPLGIFLLPGEDIPLRIFEPRYIQLIEESREEGFTFAMPFVIEDQIQDYGCEVKLQQVVAENPSGRMVVTIEGVAVVKIESFTKQMDDKLYAGGTVNVLPEPEIVTNRALIELINQYREHFDNKFLNDAELYSLNLFDIASALNLSSEEKYKFITMNDLFRQEQFLVKQMNYLMLIREQEQLLGNKFELN